jgi:hypothetical protein
VKCGHTGIRIDQNCRVDDVWYVSVRDNNTCSYMRVYSIMMYLIAMHMHRCTCRLYQLDYHDVDRACKRLSPCMCMQCLYICMCARTRSIESEPVPVHVCNTQAGAYRAIDVMVSTCTCVRAHRFAEL